MQDDRAREVGDDVEYFEGLVVDALTRGEPIDAHALTLLVRQYQLTARADLGELAGLTLASLLETSLDTSGLEAPAAPASILERAARLALFVEVSAASDDERITAAIEALTRDLRGGWRSPAVEQSAAAIGACLDAAQLDAHRAIASAAIDELERLVGRAYVPGEGVGGFADQVRTASALLTAYELSGRLPYSMLAEELMQLTRQAGDNLATDFAASCDAARVYCRLARLHDDAAYRAAAVVAPDADYRRDARRLLDRHADDARRRGVAGAIYGLAQLELESPQSAIHHPQS